MRVTVWALTALVAISCGGGDARQDAAAGTGGTETGGAAGSLASRTVQPVSGMDASGGTQGGEAGAPVTGGPGACSGSCPGTCHGRCTNGRCSASGPDGLCLGTCSGTCTGECDRPCGPPVSTPPPVDARHDTSDGSPAQEAGPEKPIGF